MEDKLRESGYDVNRARLITEARKAAKVKDRSMAFQRLHKAVMADSGLLVALVGRETIDSRVDALLSRCIQDEKGGASHLESESQPRTDRPAPQKSRSSLLKSGSQLSSDRPAPNGSAASHPKYESRTRIDRRTASPTKITRTAAIAVAQSGIWGERVMSHFEKTYGEITQYDFLNLGINNAVTQELHKGLSKVKWPGLHVPLARFEDPKKVEAIKQKVNAARDRELAQVKRVAHG